MKKITDLKVALYFLPLGIISGIFSFLYQKDFMGEKFPKNVTVIPVAIQNTIITFVCVYFGIKLSRKVNLLKKISFDKSGIFFSLLVGLASALVISLYDKFFSQSFLLLNNNLSAYKISINYLMVGILYGGFVEEFILRLLLMSLIIFISSKIYNFFSKKNKFSSKISSSIYIFALIITTLLFAAGHLPITFATLGSSPAIIFRCFILNGFAGILFGLLYYKRGIQYAIIAHASTHIIIQLIILPIISKL
ncbi:MAG: CPBP family glutamic-type intramembrane protease [Fusobacteriaceae bacterium]